DHPEHGPEIRRRYAELVQAGGVVGEEAVRPIRQALLDRNATLPHDRGRTARELLGILDAKQTSADTVRVEFREHRYNIGEAKRELTVQLTPTRFHEEGPAVRARTVDGRLVMSIDVTAAPERIRSDFWSELARQMSIRGALTPHVADRAA